MSKKMLMIENDGEVDVMAFTLMGASSKRGKDGQIGFFGSGNKYAIANLMRREIDFAIFSGVEQIGVLRKPVTYRETNFDKIAFEFKGQEIDTSITTSMGPKWEPWYILRELYCNALDEGGCRVEMSDVGEGPLGAPGKTRIYIELVDDLIDVVNHWNAYFTKDRLDLIEHIPVKELGMFDNTDEVSLYHKYDEKFRIYRKGVLVYVSDEKSIFDYDFPSADINEERVLSNIWVVKRLIARSVAIAASSSTLKRLVKGMDKYHRNGLSFAEGAMHFGEYSNKNNKAWKEAVDGLTIINQGRKETYTEEMKAGNTVMLDTELSYSLSNIDGVDRVLGVPLKGLKHSFREVNPMMEHRDLVDKAFEFLVLAGFDFGDIKIQTVEFDDYAISGMADHAGNVIYIGQNCFDKGLKYLVTTLMEEHSHLSSRFHDETRAFQNYLIDKWLVEIEKRMEISL